MRSFRCGLIAITIVSAGAAVAADNQCLTQEELAAVARMGSTMGLGGALNRCGQCLGDRYGATVKAYEDSGMLVEFRRSEAAMQKHPAAKIEYADDLVRMMARSYATDMAADCSACASLADTVDTLTQEDARASFNQDAVEKIAKMPAFRNCS